MSERSSPFEAAIALVIRVAGAGLVFGMQVLLARLMPDAGYGHFVTLWTWMLALGSFAALGLAEASVRFLPRYQARGRTGDIHRFWRFGLVVVSGAGLVIAALGAVLALWLDLDGVGLTVLLVALGLPLLGLEYFLEGVARALGWFRVAAVPVYILRPLLIAGAGLALAGFGVELTLPVIGAVLIGSMALVVALMGAILARRLARSGAASAAAGRGRLWMAVSLPLLVWSGLEDLTSYADVLVLSLLAEPEVVGVYFAAARALALAGFVAYAMTLVWGRRFALDLAGADRSVLQASLIQSTRLTLWATILAVGLAVAAGPWLLAAFGEGFSEGHAIMAVLGLGLVVRALAGQAGEALIVLGRQREGLMIGAGVLLLTAMLGLFLVPTWGAMGAAFASVIAMAARTAALALVLWRTDRLRVVSLSLPMPRAA